MLRGPAGGWRGPRRNHILVRPAGLDIPPRPCTPSFAPGTTSSDPAPSKIRSAMKQMQIEREFGIPFPGEILDPEQWTKTALKQMPADAALDWRELFGRAAPVVLDLGCGNGRFLIGSALRRADHDHLGIDTLPVV